MSRMWGGVVRIAGRKSTLVMSGIVVGVLFVPHGAAFAVKAAQEVFVSNGSHDPVPTREQNVDGDGNVEVSDASSRAAVRYEGVDGPVGPDVIVPEVPEGKTFLISYVNVVGGSAVSGTKITEATCSLIRRRTSEDGGTTTGAFAGLPVSLSGGQNIAVSESMSLPLHAGETLLGDCRTLPQPQSGFFQIKVVGHYIAAT